MKAQRGPDGRVYAFRPRENARRMNQGARYLKGPEVPEELFLRGIEEVTRANLPYVPPHGSGAALYLRPMYLGVGDNVGVKPATKYVFRIFVSPVGPYYRGGFGPDQGKRVMVSRYDRAAPQGSGHVKAGGNYASSFLPGAEAKEAGFVDAIYLDPVEHRYIEEVGAANFLGFKGDTLLTPKSASILRSVTRVSLLEIASGIFGWPTEERKIAVDELGDPIRCGMLRNGGPFVLDFRHCRRRQAVGLPVRRALAGTVRRACRYSDRGSRRSVRVAVRDQRLSSAMASFRFS